MKTCGAGPIPARFNRWTARPPKIKHCQTGSGYTCYKVYSRTASFPGRRIFRREKRQRRCGKEREEVEKESEREVRITSGVTFQKRIVSDEPDAYAEVKVEFEGLQESRVAEVQELFKKFAAEVEGMLLEDTSLYV